MGFDSIVWLVAVAGFLLLEAATTALVSIWFAAGAVVALIIGLAGGLVLTVVGVALTPQLLRWMGTPADVLPNSIAYFRPVMTGRSGSPSRKETMTS